MRGLSVFVLSLLTALAVSGSRRTYLPEINLCDSSVVLPSWPVKSTRGLIEVRGALKKDRDVAGESSTWWEINLGAGYRVTLRSYNPSFASLVDERLSRVTLYRGDSIIARTDMSKGFAPQANAFNTLIVELDSLGNIAVAGGTRIPEAVFAVNVSRNLLHESPSVKSCGCLDISNLFVESDQSISRKLMTDWTEENLREHIKSSRNPVEGVYEYLDRNNDPHYARLGGRYLIAVVSDGSSAYDIIYIDGARTNESSWTTGMLKGHLEPVKMLVDQFYLVWYDALGEKMTEDIDASIEQNAILTFRFPLYKTVIRFLKRPLK